MCEKTDGLRRGEEELIGIELASSKHLRLGVGRIWSRAVGRIHREEAAQNPSKCN
jgi:hypothetical protein